MEVLADNYIAILGALTVLIGAFVAISKKTKNQTDDKIAGFLQRGLSLIKKILLPSSKK